MTIKTVTEQIRTKGHDDCVDLTERVQRAVTEAGLTQGLATVFVAGSTAGVTTIEYEPGLVGDFQEALRRLFPEDLRYRHHDAPGEDNGFAHLRASCIGPSLTVPIVGGRLHLGTWQQIILVDFDVRARQRSVLIQLFGN
jgi:secondary thiamine-phosphate synthase enzyme